MGRFGQKTGKGWYVYGDDRKPMPDPEVLALIERAASAAGIRRRPFTNEEIIERTIYALINEGARVLEEGFASRAADIDVVYTNGYGFPAWRGGPMFYADRVGLAKVYERVVGVPSRARSTLGAGAAARPPGARGLDVQGVRQEPRLGTAPAHDRRDDDAPRRATCGPSGSRPPTPIVRRACERHRLHAGDAAARPVSDAHHRFARALGGARA